MVGSIVQSKSGFTTSQSKGIVNGMGPGDYRELVALVILGIGGLVVYRLIQWLRETPRTADPWGQEIDDAVNRTEAVLLCHHCMTPQEHNGWFCPQCGATVGPYCNYLPFVNAFSQGEVLRAGVTERLRHSPLMVIGLVLFPVSLFAPLAPIYWFFLFRHHRDSQRAQ
jgi:hypothetical protein